MVISVKNILSAVIISLLLNTACFSSPQLLLTTDKTEYELGHPVRVKLYGISLENKLAEISLDILNENFGVIADYSTDNTHDERWPNKPVQILQFRLYPRTVGKISVPSLWLNKIHSNAISLNITAGSTGLPGIKIATTTPYQRQQQIIHLNLTTDNSNARLTPKTGGEAKGFTLVPLAFSRTQMGNGKYLLQTGWALTPSAHGKQTFELPPVEYSISGGSRKLFYLPLQNMNVIKLPAYLPPTIPVAKVSVESTLSPAGLLYTDSLSFWTIRISANVSNTYSLPPVLRQVKSGNHLSFFPVTSVRKINATGDTVTSQVTHTIPFKSTKSGRLNLPEIQFQYFDPEIGKITTTTYIAQQAFVLSYMWLILLIIILIMMLVWMVKFIYKKWNIRKESQGQLEQAIQLLHQPAAKKNIRESLRHFSAAEGWPSNATVFQWKENWLKKYHTDENFESLAENISRLCYSNQGNIDSTAICRDLLQLITNRKRIKRFTPWST